MFSFQSFTSTFRRFATAQSGTTAITFALSIVPVLLAAGAAVDYTRYSDARTKIQVALDAASLSVASSTSLSKAQRLKAGADNIAANLKSAGIDPSMVNADFKITGNGISATARYDLPTGLMQIAGLTHMNIEVETDINLPEAKKAEIALVLDYSGSMTEKSGGQVKYVAMKNAAKKLVTDLQAANPKGLKVGLVPFSHHVYVTMPESFIVGKTGRISGRVTKSNGRTWPASSRVLS